MQDTENGKPPKRRVTLPTLSTSPITTTYKALIIGDSGVGKTTLIRTFLRNSYPDDTKPSDCDMTIPVSLIQNNIIKEINIRDTRGETAYNKDIHFYHSHEVIVLCFSMVNPESFENLKIFLHNNPTLLRQNAPRLLLVGTQSDLRSMHNEATISPKEIKAFAQTIKAEYIISSSAKKAHVRGLMLKIARLAQKYRDISSLKHIKALQECIDTENTFLSQISKLDSLFNAIKNKKLKEALKPLNNAITLILKNKNDDLNNMEEITEENFKKQMSKLKNIFFSYKFLLYFCQLKGYVDLYAIISEKFNDSSYKLSKKDASTYFDICNLLIMAPQRIPRYELLLHAIEKEMKNNLDTSQLKNIKKILDLFNKVYIHIAKRGELLIEKGMDPKEYGDYALILYATVAIPLKTAYIKQSKINRRSPQYSSLANLTTYEKNHYKPMHVHIDESTRPIEGTSQSQEEAIVNQVAQESLNDLPPIEQANRILVENVNEGTHEKAIQQSLETTNKINSPPAQASTRSSPIIIAPSDSGNTLSNISNPDKGKEKIEDEEDNSANRATIFQHLPPPFAKPTNQGNLLSTNEGTAPKLTISPLPARRNNPSETPHEPSNGSPQTSLRKNASFLVYNDPHNHRRCSMDQRRSHLIDHVKEEEKTTFSVNPGHKG